MADLSITAAQVLHNTAASIKHGTAAVAITPGQSVYELADGTIGLADANGTAPANTCVGIALNSAGAGQKVSYQMDSTIVIGAAASVAQGTVYVVSATAGGICPEADISSGQYMIPLGIGDDSNGIVLNIHNSGVAHV